MPKDKKDRKPRPTQRKRGHIDEHVCDHEMLLGRLVEHDPASRNYEHARKVVRPWSVTHDLNAKALDQGDRSACVGFATAQWLNCARNIGARVTWNNKTMGSARRYTDNHDGLDLYGKATLYDQWAGEFPPIDEGSSALGAAKALRSLGVIDRYEWTFSFGAFLTALQFQPVMLGINWYAQMFYPDERNVIRREGELFGGHQVLARGVNHSKKLVRIRNNWNIDWGLNGDAFIPFEDLEQLLIHEQGDSMIFLPKAKV